MYAYCLFCETQRCKALSRMIPAYLMSLDPGYAPICYSPQIIQRKWIKGVMHEERHDWLPGYLFLYTVCEIPKFKVPGLLRWLGNGVLQGSDLEFANILYEKQGVMGILRAAEIGDRVQVDDPAWAGLNGRITRLDRNRKRCCVEFDFDGRTMSIWVGYDLVRTDETVHPA